MKWPWQKAARRKLDQPAAVFWIAGSVHHRSFTSVPDAVRFIMEELAEPHRVSGRIMIEDGSLTTEQIAQLYKTDRRTKSIA
jgi:hypothetical protein